MDEFGEHLPVASDMLRRPRDKDVGSAGGSERGMGKSSPEAGQDGDKNIFLGHGFRESYGDGGETLPQGGFPWRSGDCRRQEEVEKAVRREADFEEPPEETGLGLEATEAEGTKDGGPAGGGKAIEEGGAVARP